MMTDYHSNNINTAFQDDGCTRPNWNERGTRNTMDRDDSKNSNDNVPLPFMPEPDRLDRRGGRHHHRSSRRQHHGRHPEPDSLQLLDEFMTMERMHNDDDDDYHFSPRRRHEQEPQELYPPYAAPSGTSRHSWDGPDSSSNRREQQLQQQPRVQPHGRHRATTNNTTAVSMDHHESLERNTSAPYGSYGGHGPMPHGSSSSSNNLQSSFEPYGIHNNNGSNISPHPNHHYHASEQHQPYVHNNNNPQQQQHHYQPNYVVSANGSTPGPIVTSYPYAVPSSSHHGMPPSFGNSYYGSPSWGPPIQQQQLPLPIVEYIYNIQSSDVLCGRGGATNSHSGNRSFRSLVKRHQDKYLKAKKRDKPGVAALIVDLIRNRGGRFLRRHDESMNHGNGNLGGGNMTGQHHVLWVDIGNERAREKTCQALREGAPELRRRRSRGASTSSSSDDDNDEDRRSPLQKRKVTSYLEDEEDGNNKAGMSSQKVKSEQSTLKRGFDDTAVVGGGTDRNVDDAGHAHHTPVVTMSTSALSASTASTDVRDDLECLQHEQDVPHSEVENNHDHDHDHDNEPLMIRPCPILMRRPVCAITISELSPRDQELYLNDFLPPHSNIRQVNNTSRNQHGGQVVLMAREYTSVCSDHDDNDINDDDDDDDDAEGVNECWEV